MPRILIFLAVALTVAACAAPVPDLAAGAAANSGPALPHSIAPPIAPAVADARQAIAQVAIDPVLEVDAAAAPAVVDLREAIQAVVPEAVLEVADRAPGPANGQAVALIVRWEVGSAARYTRRYQRPVWPGGASGATWGIGYDGGQATTRDIRRAWAGHPQLERLVSTAGVSGTPAAGLTRTLQDVVTPYAHAERVFIDTSLPEYQRATRRAFGPGVELLSHGGQAALEDLTYNRGGSMAGDRNREKREIRDRCIPAQDHACIAQQLRSMKRLWPDVRGLRDRRDDEAQTALN